VTARGALRSLGVALLLVALYVAVGTGLAYGFARAARWIPTPSRVGSLSPWFLLTTSATLDCAFALATWLVGARLAARSWVDLGWRPAGGVLRQGARGAALGAGAAALAVALAVATAGGAIHVTSDWAGELGLVAPLAAGLLLAALFEELLFRGFPLRQLGDALGRWPAVLLLAVAFGASHAWNDHAGVFAIVNLALAGVWLSIAFFSAGGMALAWGLHFGWNIGLALLNAPVSGISLGLRDVAYQPGPHAWIDGGAFGPEGGIVGTVAICAGIVAVVGRPFANPRAWLV
jgi:uncharacterized protein